MESNTLKVSFPDCPNKCTNGVLFNPYNGVKIPCPYCEEKRKARIRSDEQVKSEEEIYKTLRITKPFTGTDFDVKRVIPESSLKYLVEESVLSVEKELNNLMLNIGIGEYPDYSLLFNLGKKGNPESVYVPFMLKAYQNGLSVAPLLDVITLCRLRFELEEYGYNFASSDSWGSTLKDYINADICVVLIDTGVTGKGIDAVKGLMQLRAQKGKPTLIFTNAWGNKLSELYTEDNYKTCTLATLVSVEYIKKKIEPEMEQVAPQVITQPQSRFGVTGQEFKGMFKDNKNML